MTKPTPTVSSTEGQQLVSPPGKGPIQALYKVKWSKYNFFKHLHKSEDTEVLGGLRAQWDQSPIQQTNLKELLIMTAQCALLKCYTNTIAQRQFLVLLVKKPHCVRLVTVNGNNTCSPIWRYLTTVIIPAKLLITVVNPSTPTCKQSREQHSLHRLHARKTKGRICLQWHWQSIKYVNVCYIIKWIINRELIYD